MNVLLVATYELGHQPLNLAGPAARLRAHGHSVRALDISVDPWDPMLVASSDKVAFSVPMHTATRMVRELAARVDKPVCCYGLYAGMCDDVAERVIAGEYEDALVDWVEHGTRGDTVDLTRAAGTHCAPVPDRALLPPLDRYARLVDGDESRLAGYVEASRGCTHRCRHCPVPVVYDGRVRVTAQSAVLGDVEQLVDAGASHITFGDPDFLNAPAHSMRVVRALHGRFPQLTFDCTVKVEHVLRHDDLWPELAAAGCSFVVSAFESLNDTILERLDKGHTAADAARAVTLLRAHGIDVRPSFLPFTPWTTRDDVRSLLDFVHEHDLVGSVDSVQYTIRLLLPRASLLLHHPDLAPYLGEWDDERLTYRWRAADPAVDELQVEIAAIVEASTEAGEDAATTYARVRTAAGAPRVDLSEVTLDRPRLSESWFCCAEPTEAQGVRLRS
jgi:radical SAM superfamily enzyme YgiQ (UPF0313 family)